MVAALVISLGLDEAFLLECAAFLCAGANGEGRCRLTHHQPLDLIETFPPDPVPLLGRRMLYSSAPHSTSGEVPRRFTIRWQAAATLIGPERVKNCNYYLFWLIPILAYTYSG